MKTLHSSRRRLCSSTSRLNSSASLHTTTEPTSKTNHHNRLEKKRQLIYDLKNRLQHFSTGRPSKNQLTSCISFSKLYGKQKQHKCLPISEEPAKRQRQGRVLSHQQNRTLEVVQGHGGVAPVQRQQKELLQDVHLTWKKASSRLRFASAGPLRCVTACANTGAKSNSYDGRSECLITNNIKTTACCHAVFYLGSHFVSIK